MSCAVFSVLHCPFCGGALQPRPSPRLGDEPGYGMLCCDCGNYPVVAGIPILKKDANRATRQPVTHILNLVAAGRHREALHALLMPPAPSPEACIPAWLRAWPSRRGVGRLKSLWAQPARRAWRERAEVFLSQPPDKVTVRDWLDFYYDPPLRGRLDPYSYYTHCFGTPRYLTGLSLASLIQAPDKPILDVGCGSGYFTRHLVSHAAGQPVIGIDSSYFALYVAKGWVAPQAAYVCADADVVLPFPDDTFAAVFSANAFQLFTYQVSCLRELKRVTGQRGIIIVVAVRNGLVKAHLYRRTALPPAGYARLVADMPHRLVGNTAVVTRYLQKQGPDLARVVIPEALADEQWLSVVASHQPEVFRDSGPFEDWPHALGHFALNPLYVQDGPDASGQVQLRLRMPSPWFEQEDGDCRRYLPETVSLKAEVLRDLTEGRRTRDIDALLAQCIVVGLPERFR
jgi:SAM-dependent methyltransferase/uncharacterized protein YbaR (Trm112 family)